MFKQTIKLGNVKINCFRIQSSKGMGMEIHDYLHYMHNYTHEICLTEHLHSVFSDSQREVHLPTFYSKGQCHDYRNMTLIKFSRDSKP